MTAMPTEENAVYLFDCSKAIQQISFPNTGSGLTNQVASRNAFYTGR